MVVTSLGALGVAVGLGGWLWQSRRRPASPATASTAQADLKAFKRSLSRCQYLEHVDTRMAQTALQQFEQAEDRFKLLRARLQAKFEPGELTYSRYLSAADLVHQAILEHLREVEAMMNHLESIDVPYARAELLKQATGAQPADLSTTDSLSERLGLAQQIETKIRASLAYNERALTELDRVTGAVLAIKTSKDSSGVDLEAAIEELRELAARAKKYSL